MVTRKFTDVFRGIFLVWVGESGVLRGRIFPLRNFSWGKRLSLEGAHDFLSLLKKKKLNMKSFFSTESEKQH